MTKIKCMLVLFIIFTGSLFSQLDIGTHAGLTISNGKYVGQALFWTPIDPEWTTRDYEVRIKSESSFSFGGLIETKLYSFLYFQVEVNYLYHKLHPAQIMFFQGNERTLLTSSLEYRFRYIEVPLLLKIKFDYNKFLPYCFAGVGIGLLNKATEKTEYQSPWLNFPPTEDDVSQYTKHEQSFVTLGIGTDYLLSDMFSIFLTMKYSNSLVDIAKAHNVNFKPHNYDVLLGIKTRIINY